MKYKLLSVD